MSADLAAGETPASRSWSNPVRRLYDWVLSWAESRFAGSALFVLAFIESSFFPIPPDTLLIPLGLGRRRRAFRYALICSLGSVFGGALGYLIGYALWTGTALPDLFYRYVPGFTEANFDSVSGLYREWDFWVVFAAGFTPIPYKVITITAGVVRLNFAVFLVASAVGRSARFFLVSALVWYFGPPIRGFVDRYFNLLALLFTALLVGGFLLVGWLSR